MSAHPELVEGCVLCALCGCFSLAACRGAAPMPEPRLNVLLVTIDTLRADRIGIGLAPAIDRLAESGVRFTAARAAVPLTLPSHATILTGLLPRAHGVRENGADTLSEAHPTIARLLKPAGYRTAAFVGAFVLDRHFGLAQGFDVYDDQIPRDPAATERLEAERPAQAVVDRALAWLEHAAPGTAHPAPGTAHPAPGTAHPAPGTEHPAPSTEHPAPFFVWIHLYDPHAPYSPPPEFRARAKSDYDGEIVYADSQIARVFEWLRASGLADQTLIILAGDHGEGLGDHGERTHGMLLYDSTLRVPLVIAAPGRAAARRDEAVSLADIAPTILRAAGVSAPVEMKGRDLLEEVRLKADTTYQNDRGRGNSNDRGRGNSNDRGRGNSNDRGRGNSNVRGLGNSNVRSVRLQADLYAETEYPRVAGWSPLQALTDGRWMAIRAGASTELYDLERDPREEHDLSAAQRATAAALTSRIDALGTAAAPSNARTISLEAQERLHALGYVASAVPSPASKGAPNPAAMIAVWNAFEDALSALNARKPDAVPVLKRLAEANSAAPVFLSTYARALKDFGDPSSALAIYRQAVRRWPTDSTLLHDLAVAAREAAGRLRGAAAAGLRNEAARAEEAAIALSPSSATAQNGLGLLAIDDGRPEQAAAAFERAAAIDPNNASYWTNLGNARRAVGDRTGAEQAYRRALDVDARAADAANGLGVLLVEAHRPADAVPWLERAVAAAPDFVEARLNLGIARQQAGDPTGAAEEYRRVLAAPAGPRERQAARKLLAAIETTR